MSTQFNTQKNPLLAKYGPNSTASVLDLLFDQCQEGLSDAQLEFIQGSTGNTLCTLENITRTMENIALGIERDSNMLADENAATAFLYSLSEQLGDITKTLQLAEKAREELAERRIKQALQLQQGRAA